MKRITFGVLWCLCLTLLISVDFASSTDMDAKITVLNPRGIQPPIRLIPMAPRIDALDGKTIYVVDTKYPLTRPFVEEVYKIFRDKYPKTNWIFREKIGSYFDDDPKLWQEIKEKGHGMIMAIGH